MKILPILFLTLILAGCENDCDDKVTTCPTPETMEEFPWVMELVDEMGECGEWMTAVVRGKLDSSDIVYTIMNDPQCDGIFTGPLYDCRGNIIRTISVSETDQEIIRNHVSVDIILRQCR